MKVSLTRLNEARELRDIALTLLDRQGMNVILVDRDRQIQTRQHHVGDLKITQSAPMGEQILDVYSGRKVFSVRWNDVDAIDVVSFKPGDWRQALRSWAMPPSEWRIESFPKRLVSDGGPNFRSGVSLRPHIEKFFNDQTHVRHFVSSARAPVKN